MSLPTLRFRGGWARLRAARDDERVASLTLGAEMPPTTEFVTGCLERLRSQGFTSVFTNALTPADSLPFVDAGFTVRERLHLLMHDLQNRPKAVHATARGRRRDREAVLAVDAQSFDGFWRLDQKGLDDALTATPSSRFRVGRRQGEVVGYAVTGRVRRHGYLQRLAVHPAARRQGWGQSLVADTLAWLGRHSARRAVVNTQYDNAGALELYRACGFEPLPVGLCILGRDL